MANGQLGSNSCHSHDRFRDRGCVSNAMNDEAICPQMLCAARALAALMQSTSFILCLHSWVISHMHRDENTFGNLFCSTTRAEHSVRESIPHDRTRDVGPRFARFCGMLVCSSRVLRSHFVETAFAAGASTSSCLLDRMGSLISGGASLISRGKPIDEWELV